MGECVCKPGWALGCKLRPVRLRVFISVGSGDGGSGQKHVLFADLLFAVPGIAQLGQEVVQLGEMVGHSDGHGGNFAINSSCHDCLGHSSLPQYVWPVAGRLAGSMLRSQYLSPSSQGAPHCHLSLFPPSNSVLFPSYSLATSLPPPPGTSPH